MEIKKGICRPCEAAKLAAAKRASGELPPTEDVIRLPDFGLLGPLKRSAEYAAIRRRVADPSPMDAWEMDMTHYFVFELRRTEAADPASEPPYALFKMRWEDDGPLDAMVITPDVRGGEPRVEKIVVADSVPPSTLVSPATATSQVNAL